MEKGGTVIEAGPVSFGMSYRREIMNDQGLCLQVYSEIDGKDTEILRFDCFDQTPHCHYGPENHNIRLNMDKTTAGNPLGWTLNNIRHRLSDMVLRAGYDDLAAKLEANPISKAKLDTVEATARELSSNERRTVHHMMPEMLDGDKVEVGNLKFGLEYRHLPQISDEGMAIHVLAEVAGQARKRGREWMQAVTAVYPDITIILYPNTGWKDTLDYELLGPFADGMLEGLGLKATLVDSGQAYQYQTYQ